MHLAITLLVLDFCCMYMGQISSKSVNGISSLSASSSISGAWCTVKFWYVTDQTGNIRSPNCTAFLRHKLTIYHTPTAYIDLFTTQVHAQEYPISNITICCPMHCFSSAALLITSYYLHTLQGTKVGYRKILSKVSPTWKVVVFTLRDTHTHEKLQTTPIWSITYTCIVVIHKWNAAKWIHTTRHQLLLHSLNSLPRTKTEKHLHVHILTLKPNPLSRENSQPTFGKPC